MRSNLLLVIEVRSTSITVDIIWWFVCGAHHQIIVRLIMWGAAPHNVYSIWAAGPYLSNALFAPQIMLLVIWGEAPYNGAYPLIIWASRPI